MVDGGNMNETNLSYILKELPFGIHEIMMHPGMDTHLFIRCFFSWGYHWEDEYQALVFSGHTGFVGSAPHTAYPLWRLAVATACNS
jgi:hypothetical protein